MQNYSFSFASEGKALIVPRPRGGDWLEDDIKQWQRDGITRIASLLESKEARDLALQDEQSLAEQHGIEFSPFEIPDRGTPHSLAAFIAYLKALKLEIDRGQIIGVHCRQGIGRSGMVIIGLLMLDGHGLNEAIEQASLTRGVQVPETEEQRQWLKQLADIHARSAA